MALRGGRGREEKEEAWPESCSHMIEEQPRVGRRKAKSAAGKMERAYSGGVWMHIPSVWARSNSLFLRGCLRNLIACIRWRRPMGDAGGDQRCGCALDKSPPHPAPCRPDTVHLS